MRTIKELFRLVLGFGFSTRKAAQSLNVSHTTVGRYFDRAIELGLTWSIVEGMEEGEIEEMLFPGRGRRSSEKPEPDWSEVHVGLKKKGVTLQLLWEEYRLEHSDGYCYSRFCDLYKKWKGGHELSMHQEHKAGEKLFVDYAGQTVAICDSETGEVRPASIFVAVLGASSYTYAEAQWGMDLSNWIGGHVRSFEYFGGAPGVLVPDNLKVGVKSHCFYEPEVNPTYLDMALHYGAAVIPTRVRKPKDKAKVEVGVQVVERRILAPLRNRTFFSLEELNHAISQLLDELNGRVMKHVGKTRRELFEAIDRPALRGLPTRRYELSTIRTGRVNIDYHVEFQGSYYSVPYRYSRLDVEVRGTERSVEIFHKGERIASHLRSSKARHYSTEVDHMPPGHKAMAGWSGDRFIAWAEKIGPWTVEMVKAILLSRDHPEQGYRSCLGLLRLVKSYPEERIDAACQRALRFGLIQYKGVANILKRGLDQVELSDSSSQVSGGTHSNIRGADYYEGVQDAN